MKKQNSWDWEEEFWNIPKKNKGNTHTMLWFNERLKWLEKKIIQNEKAIQKIKEDK